MIRVNLLKARGGSGERIQAVLNPGGPSAFISKREVILGGLFVALGCLILATQLRVEPSEQEVAAEAAAATDSSEALLSRPPDRQEALPPPLPRATIVPAPPVEEQPAAASTTPPPPIEQPRPSTPPPDRTPPPAPPAQPLAARTEKPAPRPRISAPVVANSVTNLSIEPQGDSIEISLQTGARQEYSTFRLDNPRRVVIDLNGLGLDLPQQQWTQSVGHPLLSRLRIALNRVDPPRVRMVLEVPEFPVIMPLPRQDGLTLRLSPAAQP